MLYRSALLVLFITILMWTPPLGTAQDSTDWRKHYGSPAAERYIIRDGIIMTVFYSEEGLTCRAVVHATPPRSPASFDEVLNEIIPIGDRGKQITSFGLTSSLAGIASMDYARVHISLGSTGEGAPKGATTGNVDSAIIQWKGIPCRLPEQKQTL
jgi:hypothetical protein